MTKLQARVQALRIALEAVTSMREAGNWDEDDARNILYDEKSADKIEKELKIIENYLYNKYNRVREENNENH